MRISRYFAYLPGRRFMASLLLRKYPAAPLSQADIEALMKEGWTAGYRSAIHTLRSTAAQEGIEKAPAEAFRLSADNLEFWLDDGAIVMNLTLEIDGK